MEKKLSALSKRTGRSKSSYMKRALAQNLEDMEDIELADQSRAEILAGGGTIPLSTVMRRYGLKSRLSRTESTRARERRIEGTLPRSDSCSGAT